MEYLADLNRMMDWARLTAPARSRTGPGDLFEDVQVLAGHHFGAHQVEDQPCPAAGGGPVADFGEGFLAEGQAQVAGQDGGRVAEPFAVQRPALGLVQFAEAAVDAGAAPAGVRAVDDVVVDQGRGLEQLQGRAGRDDLAGAGLAAGAAPAPVAHERPQPLSARDQVGDGAHQRIDVRGDRGHDGLAAGQEIGELAGDGGHEGRLLEPQLLGEASLDGLGSDVRADGEGGNARRSP